MWISPVNLWNKKIAIPLLISSMTGGTEKAGEINRILARAAQETGVALGVGSQRVGLEHPEFAAIVSSPQRRAGYSIICQSGCGSIEL